MSSDKKAQSEEIEDQIAKFLREGGEIEKIEEGASSFKPILNSQQLKHLTARSHFNNGQRVAQRTDRRMAKIQR